MRTFWETFPIEFKGGLMTDGSPLRQGINFPGSASQLINFEPSIEGGYKKILGYNKWTNNVVPGSTNVQGVIIASADDVIAVRGGKYYVSLAKANWVQKLDLASTSGQKIRHTLFNFNGTPKVCMVDSLHRPVFYESLTDTIVQDVAAPSDVLGASRVVEHKNRLFFAKGSTLVYTAPFAETDYTPGNGAGIVNVGDTISGLIVFRDELIVFCNDKIKRLIGSSPSDFVLKTITLKTGCVDGDTIQEVGGDILYLGPDGIRYLSATERVDDFGLARASQSIQEDITTTFTGGSSYSSFTVRKKAQYRIFRYDLATTREDSVGYLGTRFEDQQPSGVAWGLVKGLKIFSADSKQFGSTEIILFLNEDGYVYEAEKGFSFDGAVISCMFTTPFMSITDPQARKTYYKHTLYLKSEGEVDISLRVILDFDAPDSIQPQTISIQNNTSGSAIWGAITWGSFIWGGAIRSAYENQIVGSSFGVALSYSESSTLPSFSLDTAILEYKQNDRK
jgi:hypothetical protein